MKKNIFPAECAICKDNIVLGKFDSVKLKMYDIYEPHKSYPRIIEITADNICNLQCVMCSSIHSSLIAKKHNVTLNYNLFDSSIIEEFNELIPFLEKVVFSGGEPFLSPSCKTMMKNILSKNPKCTIAVNTNGTILTEEIKLMMDQGKFHFNISIDSIHKETYEKIRIGAHFETLMKNIQYFSDYSSKVNDPITVPICPLVLNYHELTEIVEFCNHHAFNVIFVHVFNAHDVALNSADPQLMKEAVQIFESATFIENGDIQRKNAQVFREFVEDVKQNLVFNQQKTDFIKKIKIDELKFINGNKKLENKMSKYIAASVRENAENRFETWKNKKDQVFALLPDYYKSEVIFKSLYDFPEEMLFFYFDQLPVHELKNYLITFCNEIIRKRVN
jgi:MoaA/NifB/PqqE/SkfB family radical SAM enzyme